MAGICGTEYLRGEIFMGRKFQKLQRLALRFLGLCVQRGQGENS